jgi:hypothetical protein
MYHIFLLYKQEPRGTQSRRIVYDKSEIAATRFSGRISRTGAQTELYSKPLGRTISPPTVAGFPWDVSRLCKNLLDLDAVAKTHTLEEVKIVEGPGGDIVGSFPVKNSQSGRITFECRRDFGLNLANVKIFFDENKPPIHDYRIQWKKGEGDVWYISSLVDDHYSIGHKITIHRELILKDFRPNIPVAKTMFTRESLQAPDGSRILDRRANVAAKAQ